MEIRTGIGFDAHEFEEGKPLFLGGVRIPADFGLKGHSDGDALLHALTDAILGALGEPDIGEIFSDGDERWRSASSTIFLREALSRMDAKGFSLVNVDCVVVTDRLRIADHKKDIKLSLAALLNVPEDRISVKGKRREGFSGGDGLVCLCTVLLRREG